MSKLMLIDATHPEETRVAVVNNGQIEDFDFEARNKRQLRGNIYLAKVTRVEPSLQAAFVDYGGNRHGFLAFSEIHPDYYQIPKEDREALLAEADEEIAKDDAEDSEEPTGALENGGADEEEEADDVEERKKARRTALFQRKYKIQEVIRRRQVMLVQVVKEERGNKGAALTTYLSLAGRYCVLMPNTSRGGGISRKITNVSDRKRLKSITSEFDIPSGAGLIVRTAGAKRTKTEVRRDFEYLTKLWQQIVGKTMESMAPALIHEEGHLVLRAVRDLYDKDVERIIVEGDEAYNEARTFVKMLMPSHTRKVVQHEDNGPLFVMTGVEDQLEGIYTPTVHLPSGGYIVINQTEALVAIDVNSGKATRERNVEATALKTNMEAAAEASRQMRLRDLAGLIVIDFIDMEDGKNNRAVEKKMKDCLKIDRARVQTGRISQFGLFEISRQRRRAGVLELSSEPCDHCAGTGRVRSIESAAIQLLRTIEARAADDRVQTVHVQAAPEVALYLLNEKRAPIADIERECHVVVRIEADEDLKTGSFNIEGRAEGNVIQPRPMQPIDLRKLKPLPPPAPDRSRKTTRKSSMMVPTTRITTATATITTTMARKNPAPMPKTTVMKRTAAASVAVAVDAAVARAVTVRATNPTPMEPRSAKKLRLSLHAMTKSATTAVAVVDAAAAVADVIATVAQTVANATASQTSPSMAARCWTRSPRRPSSLRRLPSPSLKLWKRPPRLLPLQSRQRRCSPPQPKLWQRSPRK